MVLPRLEWHGGSAAGDRHAPPNQDLVWWSDDGRLCLVADGATRRGQQAELASASCGRVARELYRQDAGDDLIERIVLTVNRELLRRVAADEPIGSTTLALVHISASGRVIASIMGDSSILRVRNGQEVLNVRPLRKFDYFINDSNERATADATFDGLPWWMRASLTSGLPWASQGIVPAFTDLVPLAGDTLIVCSDGISDETGPEQIAALAEQVEPHLLAAELIRRAREVGGNDDATCAVARWPA
jgi:serine/threonine protein phosphatase PrpC